MQKEIDMTATQTLEAEHRLIETVVKALGEVADRIARGGQADVVRLARAAEFLRVYADQLHHGKEEALFFPMLVKRGVPPQGCPIGGLNHEHEKGRALVRALAEQAPAYAQGKPGAKEGLLETLLGLLDLYRNHIWKEDAMVFPMAEKILTAADQQELSAGFAEVDKAVGPQAIARLEQFAKSLTRAAPPVSAPRAARFSRCGCSS